MKTKLFASLVVVAALVTLSATWASSKSQSKLSCCYEGSPCCFEGSPCCEGLPCCYEGSPCCFEGSPCCDTSLPCCDAGLPCCEAGLDCCYEGSPCCELTASKAVTKVVSVKPSKKGSCCGAATGCCDDAK